MLYLEIIIGVINMGVVFGSMRLMRSQGRDKLGWTCVAVWVVTVSLMTTGKVARFLAAQHLSQAQHLEAAGVVGAIAGIVGVKKVRG